MRRCIAKVKTCLKHLCSLIFLFMCYFILFFLPKVCFVKIILHVLWEIINMKNEHETFFLNKMCYGHVQSVASTCWQWRHLCSCCLSMELYRWSCAHLQNINEEIQCFTRLRYESMCFMEVTQSHQVKMKRTTGLTHLKMFLPIQRGSLYNQCFCTLKLHNKIYIVKWHYCPMSRNSCIIILQIILPHLFICNSAFSD